MEYTHLGQTDIRVSKMCVGCMSFGKAGSMHQWTLDEDASAAETKLQAVISRQCIFRTEV